MAIFQQGVELQNVLDDKLLTLGDDRDGVFVLNTAGLSADAELTGVIEGTSDHLGHAANTHIISNITNDGDIHILVSKAGNSHTAFLADASTGDTILNAASGASVDIYIAGVKEIDYATGVMTFQQATTLTTSSGLLRTGGPFNVDNTLSLGTNEGQTGSHLGSTFRGTNHPGGTDTNSGGADLTLAPGRGTGTGDVGMIVIQLTTETASGTGQQGLGDSMTLDMASSSSVATMTLNRNWIVAGTWDDLGIVTTIDINGGTIDGVTIGGSSVAAGSFSAIVGTTITGSGILSIDDTTDSTSLTTGSIHTDGGMGVTLDTFFGTHTTWLTSVDSVAVADQVAIGRFDIGTDNTVLAISQETAVVAAVVEADFSHAMQVRINGVTYNIMLASTLS